ncbi:MAG: AAA family ATPase [Actinomycetota bacterium]
MNGAAFAPLPFVGRTEELKALTSATEPGSRALVLGPAGSGKSRLIGELQSTVLSATFLVGTGSSHLGSTPYGVFRDIAFHASQILDPADIEWPAHLLADLGILFPHLDQSTSDASLADARRHGLWLAWLRYLAALADHTDDRLIVVIEDLHNTDAASRALVEWLAAQPTAMALIGTSRPPLAPALSRYPTVPIGPLDADAVHDLQMAVGLGDVATPSVMAATEGIPLRIREWVTSVALDGLDQAHAAALTTVVGRLTVDERHLLRAAALIDDVIAVEQMARVTELSHATVVATLDSAVRAGVVQVDNGVRRFAHDTYREALSAELADDERRGLHRRILADFRRHEPQRASMLGRLARHALGAADDHAKAAALHLAAGRQASVSLAPDSAAEFLAMAVELSEMVGDELMLLEARLELGLAMIATGAESAHEVLAQVYPLAERLEDHESYVRAALAEPISFGQVGLPMQTDTRTVGRLEAALLRADGPSWRARVLATLALQQHASLDQRAYDELVTEADALASGLNDPALDALVFAARYGVRRPIGSLAVIREQVSDRIDQLAPLDPMGPQLIDLGVVAAFRDGDLAHANALIRRLETEFDPLPLVAQWSVLRAKAAVAHATGQLDVMERLANEAIQVAGGTRLGDAAFTYFGFQVAGLLRERRNVEPAREAANAWIEANPTYAAFRSARAWMLSDVNDIAGSTSDLEVFFAQDLTELRTKVEGVLAIGMAVCAAAVCERADWCQQGWELLEPVRDEWLVVGEGTMIEGPVARVMALASSVIGETSRALAENAEAERRARVAGADLYVWHAIRDRGLILRRAGRYAEAIDAMGDASARYRSNGFDEQADWLDGLAAELDTMAERAAASAEVPSGGSSHHTSVGEFRRDRDVWHITLGEESTSLRHVKGLTMLAELLARPGQHVTAIDLAAVSDGHAPPTDTGDIGSAERASVEHLTSGHESAQVVIDDDAVGSYQARLEAITVEMDRADRREDVELSERLNAEFEAITEQLSAARGLGGRRRTMSDEGEKARVRVTKSIRSAIRRVAAAAPDTADHLERAINTGHSCVYQPDHRRPVDWAVNP